MYFHIGGNTVINIKDVVGIFDIETASVSRITREYLKEESFKKIVSASDALPKSFIVCETSGLKKVKNGKNKYTVYISQISTATLQKRITHPFDFDKDC